MQNGKSDLEKLIEFYGKGFDVIWDYNNNKYNFVNFDTLKVYEWIVDIDLEKFFDTVNQDKLITIIGKTITDGDVVSLIRKETRIKSKCRKE